MEPIKLKNRIGPQMVVLKFAKYLLIMIIVVTMGCQIDDSQGNESLNSLFFEVEQSIDKSFLNDLSNWTYVNWYKLSTINGVSTSIINKCYDKNNCFISSFDESNSIPLSIDLENIEDSKFSFYFYITPPSTLDLYIDNNLVWSKTSTSEILQWTSEMGIYSEKDSINITSLDMVNIKFNVTSIGDMSENKDVFISTIILEY